MGLGLACPICGDPNAFPLGWYDKEPPEGCPHEWEDQIWYTEQSAGKTGSEAFSEPGLENSERLKAARWRRAATCRSCGAWRGAFGLEPTPELYVAHAVEIELANSRASGNLRGRRDKVINHPNRSKKKTERAVLVTTTHRGVFFGYADDTGGASIKMRAARNCIYWSADVKGFLGLASTGPTKSCKIGPAANIELRD